ncbi:MULTISPECIES: hypothetical protein [Burkholderia]|nr:MULTISPECIES: hypothetical protein [Burkholderia]
MRIDEALDRVKDVWQDRPEGVLCGALVDFLAHRARETNRISFGLIQQMAEKRSIADQTVVAGVVQYLIGHDLHLLDPVYEYIDEDDQVFELPNSEIKYTLNNGEFFHPMTGEPDKEFETRIFLSFAPSDLAKELTAPV